MLPHNPTKQILLVDRTQTWRDELNAASGSNEVLMSIDSSVCNISTVLNIKVILTCWHEEVWKDHLGNFLQCGRSILSYFFSSLALSLSLSLFFSDNNIQSCFFWLVQNRKRWCLHPCQWLPKLRGLNQMESAGRSSARLVEHMMGSISSQSLIGFMVYSNSNYFFSLLCLPYVMEWTVVSPAAS